MRQKNYTTLALMVFCLMLGMMLRPPVPVEASDQKNDLQAIQRDVADLQDQVKGMQKGLDSKLAALQSLVQQALDTANKTNSTVSGLNSGVSQTMQTELRGVKDQLSSVTGLSSKVDGTSNDVSDLRGTVNGLVTTLNRVQQQLTDMSSLLKLMQTAPAAPPPGVDAGPGMAGSAPPPDPGKLFSHAASDQNAGNYELAISEFKQFLQLYPNDPNALRAQYNIGNSYYSDSKPDEAVKALDAAIEQYPVDQTITPSVYLMKGMALKKEKKNTAAIASFQYVVKTFPHSDEAGQAKIQLTSLGASASTATSKKPAR